MTDATILVPTHDHAALLPFALRSALAQRGVEIELFVVGDGVGDDTRGALEAFLGDPRVRFFDRPKGERHGERLRHDALQESSAPVVCYLSDDDLLLPGHVAHMRSLLGGADFAHDAPVNVWPDGALRYNAVDLADARYVERLREGRIGGLTGVSHTREAYERLPHGWRPAPARVPTDVHMWRQFATLPGFRAATGKRLTSLQFPSPLRAHMTMEERAEELERWEKRISEPGFPAELDELVAEATRQAALRLKLTAAGLENQLDAVRSTRWWRTRRAVAGLRPVRAARTRFGSGR